MRILLVENQARLRSVAKKGLEELSISVEAISDGIEAFRRATETPYDALVLDIMLQGRDGFSIVRGLREMRNTVPVILLTARATLPETLQAFDLGADDYLAKPYFVEELAARLRTIVRRKAGEPALQLRVADLAMDLLARKVTRSGEEILLTTREFELLQFLMRPPGRVFGHMEIYKQVWGCDMSATSNLLEVYMQRLRGKIDKDREPKLLRTVRNAGYVLAEK